MKPFRCVVDLDGVLVNYYAGVMKSLSGLAINDGEVPPAMPYPFTPGVWNFFGEEPIKLPPFAIAKYMNQEFYAGLDWMPDGKAILAELEKAYGVENVYIATSPWDTEGCLQGKADWIAREMPQYKRRVLIGSPKFLLANNDTVLYDDSDENVNAFRENFGYGFLVPRPWNSAHAKCDMATGAIKPNHDGLHGLHCWYTHGVKEQRKISCVLNSLPSPFDIVGLFDKARAKAK